MNRIFGTVILAAVLAGCSVDKSDAFARIETGFSGATPRARVMELLGTPAERSYRDLLGVSHERLVFKDSKRAYVVTLLNGVAISKSVENLPH